MNSIKVNPLVALVFTVLIVAITVLLTSPAPRSFTQPNSSISQVSNVESTTSTSLESSAHQSNTQIKSNDLQPEISRPFSAETHLNLAPSIELYPNACKQMELWGRDHHGGWYVCMDSIPKEQCVIYSYGLGQWWC